MAVVVIADSEVLDRSPYEQYRQLDPATIMSYGGRYLPAAEQR
jgi:uncharacterized protein (DUF1330 family)